MGVQRLNSYLKETGDIKRYQRAVQNRLTPHQLRELAQDLEKYKITENRYDVDAWLKAKGAINQYGAVILTNYKPAEYSSDQTKVVKPSDCDPILYEQLQADMKQFLEWEGRKEYAVQKQLEEYQKIT